MDEDVVIPTLETERLWLRPLCPSDLAAHTEMCADPEVMRGLGRPAWTDPEAVWMSLAALMGQWELGGWGVWAVEDKATGAFLGRIGHAHPPGWPGFELCWALLRRHWGRGYATEGARAALAYAFDTLQRDHVISLILPENQASLRVADRLGMRREGLTTMRGHDLLVYGIGPADRRGEAPVPYSSKCQSPTACSSSSAYASPAESGPSNWRTSHSRSHSSPWTWRNRRVCSMASSFDFASSIA
jgi:RimJ/RimL family protein N-acetyltransferase